MNTLPLDLLQEVIVFAIRSIFQEKKPNLNPLLCVNKQFRNIILSLRDNIWKQIVGYRVPSTKIWNINFVRG